MGGRAGGKVRVLLVDDLSDIRLVMRLLLEADGRAEVVGEAADGAEAVRLAAVLQPDAVVLDLRMPGMDGVAALPLIRDASPGTVVVALSALPVGPMTDRAIDLGATYVRKPDLRRVVNLVAALAPAPQPPKPKGGKRLGPAAA
ncbi:MAG: response regulator [Acidimicrobiia bacterium]|nr:response regulator [Acidimicrobiia bacterium]